MVWSISKTISIIASYLIFTKVKSQWLSTAKSWRGPRYWNLFGRSRVRGFFGTLSSLFGRYGWLSTAFWWASFASYPRFTRKMRLFSRCLTRVPWKLNSYTSRIRLPQIRDSRRKMTRRSRLANQSAMILTLSRRRTTSTRSSWAKSPLSLAKIDGALTKADLQYMLEMESRTGRGGAFSLITIGIKAARRSTGRIAVLTFCKLRIAEAASNSARCLFCKTRLMSMSLRNQTEAKSLSDIIADAVLLWIQRPLYLSSTGQLPQT